MKKKQLAIIVVFLLAAVSSVFAAPRWQKIMTTDQYRCYFDTLTISYGKTVPKNERDAVGPDKNIIIFNAQKIYWNPADTARILQQIDSGVDWSTVSYSVGEYQYDIGNKKICQGDISFFDANGMPLGTISRNTWRDVAPGSDEAGICDYLVQYAKKHNQELKDRA